MNGFTTNSMIAVSVFYNYSKTINFNKVNSSPASPRSWWKKSFSKQQSVGQHSIRRFNAMVLEANCSNSDIISTSSKLRVENIHYDLTEEELDVS